MHIKIIRGPAAALLIVLTLLALFTFMLPVVLLLTGVVAATSLITGTTKLFGAPKKPQIQKQSGTVIDIPAEIQ